MTTAAALRRLAQDADVVTYEFENVPVAAAETLARSVPVCPPPRALEAAQDRLAEKTFLNSVRRRHGAFRGGRFRAGDSPMRWPSSAAAAC